jgi:hypothetical protein
VRRIIARHAPEVVVETDSSDSSKRTPFRDPQEVAAPVAAGDALGQIRHRWHDRVDHGGTDEAVAVGADDRLPTRVLQLATIAKLSLRRTEFAYGYASDPCG